MAKQTATRKMWVVRKGKRFISRTGELDNFSRVHTFERYQDAEDTASVEPKCKVLPVAVTIELETEGDSK